VLNFFNFEYKNCSRGYNVSLSALLARSKYFFLRYTAGGWRKPRLIVQQNLNYRKMLICFFDNTPKLKLNHKP